MPPRQRRLLSFFACVTPEGSRWSEFAQLVTNHVLADQHFHVLTTIVNHEREPNKLRNDGTGPCPGFDWLAGTSFICLLNLAEQFQVDEGTFFL